MKKFVFIFAILGLACEREAPTIPNITNILNNVNGGQNPTASPSPTSGDLPPGSRLAILMFGVSGPSGCVKINARDIKNGCTGNITCTPKDANGLDLPEAIHGPNASWSVVSGQANVNVQRTDNPFNIDVRALALGSFALQCSVKNLTATVDFNVVQ